jgi:hypothetical protein
VFNLYNKSTLNIFPYPWFMSTIQLASGVFFMVALWVTKLYPAPKVRVLHEVGASMYMSADVLRISGGSLVYQIG